MICKYCGETLPERKPGAGRKRVFCSRSCTDNYGRLMQYKRLKPIKARVPTTFGEMFTCR